MRTDGKGQRPATYRTSRPVSSRSVLRDHRHMGEDWPRLAAETRRLRIRLGFPTTVSWANSLREHGNADLNLKTLQRIENGHSVGPSKLAALELEAGWPAGTADKILDGVPLDDILALVEKSQAAEPPVFAPQAVRNVTTEQLLDLADYAERKIGRDFSRELMRWVLDAQRAPAAQESETNQNTQRDAG
jgi:hypothetical protein